MTDRELIKKAFSSSVLFQGLPIDKSWFYKEFSRNDKISEHQNGIDCLGLLIKGSAEVSPGDGSAVSRIGAGAEFGICNIFINENMPTEITAKTACKAAFMPKDVFASLLSQDNVLMYRYVRLCNEKMIYLAEKLRLMSIQGCKERLEFWLRQNSANGEVTVKLSKDDLAKRLGISRASLFRALSQLELSGIISCYGATIVLNNAN